MADASNNALLIVGMGRTGLSCARFLIARGVDVHIVDDRDAPPALTQLRQLLPAAAITCGPFRADDFLSCRTLVLSPGVPLRTPLIQQALARGAEILGDIELFARHADAPVIAITGSNGKSTVTALLTAMAQGAGLEVRTGGNFGTPALDLLPQAPSDPAPDLYILELSSFQLETTSSLNAKAAVVLNVSPDHMDRYRDAAEYIAAKRRIYRGEGVVVINRDEACCQLNHDHGRASLAFTLGCPGDKEYGLLQHDGEPWLARGTEVLLPVRELRLTGRHNLANALAALALAEAAAIPRQACLQALRGFAGLPHRMQWVAQHHGVNWINDSKGTNVGATLAALQGLETDVVLIAGGIGKGADFTPLRTVLAEKGRALIVLGRDAVHIEQQLTGACPVRHAGSMAEAVTIACHVARAGDTVLLSPACASFDMYSGYEQRGQLFMAAVREALS